MKIISLIRIVLSFAVFVLSVSIAKAAPAYGFINLTIYGYLVNTSPVPQTAFCNGNLSLIPSTSPSGFVASISSVTKGTSVSIPANSQTFTCQVTLPYYFNNVPTGGTLAVGFYLYSTAPNSAAVNQVIQVLATVPTNWATTPVTATALL